MAIGSDGEIGVSFSRWGDMDETSRKAWFKFMQEEWGEDLHGKYAKLCFPDPAKILAIHSEYQ
jgi:hypothetical protein